MSRIFITGSSTGLGQLAAQKLVALKHDVVLHARDERKAREALASGEDILAVNTLAPYTLTCLINKPQRSVFLSSGDHRGGKPVMRRSPRVPGRR